MSPSGHPSPDPAGLRKILLLRLRRIGDVVMTTPAVVLLKKFLPDAALTYLVEDPFRRLVDGLPAVDRVLAAAAKQNRRDFIRLLRAVRRERFDAVLDFHGGPRASWITAFSGARVKVGYDIRGKRFLYDFRVPRRPDHGTWHSVQTHAALVRALGFEFGDEDIPPLALPEPTEAEARNVDERMGEAGLERGNFLVLHVGAGNAFRDWGEDRHAALLRILGRNRDLRFALIGGAGDVARQNAVIIKASESPDELDPRRIAGLAGRLNLIETKALIARAGLFIGPDSGPMHIAAAAGASIVAVFGPTLPAHFGPWRAEGRSVILQTDLDCRPCRQRKCITGDFRCLRSITAAEVAAAATRFL